MKNIKLVPFVLILFTLLLSACGNAVTPGTSSTGSDNTAASSVAFTGVILSIVGDRWLVNGSSIQLDLNVDPSVIEAGPFKAGDMVRVEARMNADGSVEAVSIATPSAVDFANFNGNDDNGNDDSDVFGVVESISESSMTVDGQVYQFAPGFEMIMPGAFVQIHLTVHSDGTLLVRAVELSNSSLGGNDNSNEDANVNDNNGNDDNSNDDNSNDDNGNDDNSNDDDNGNGD